MLSVSVSTSNINITLPEFVLGYLSVFIYFLYLLLTVFCLSLSFSYWVFGLKCSFDTTLEYVAQVVRCHFWKEALSLLSLWFCLSSPFYIFLDLQRETLLWHPLHSLDQPSLSFNDLTTHSPMTLSYHQQKGSFEIVTMMSVFLK